MTASNHALTGAVIALTVKVPVLAVPFAFLSHFAQDALPHWDFAISRQTAESPHFFTKRFTIFLIADLSLAFLLMIILALLFPSQKWLVWACMIAAAVPDAMWAYYRLYREKILSQKPKYDPLARFHMWLQWSQTAKGGLVEIAWFLVAGAIILSLR